VDVQQRVMADLRCIGS